MGFTADRAQRADPGSTSPESHLVADYAKRGKTVVWAMDLSTEGSVKEALIQDVVSEEAGVIARPDTCFTVRPTAPDRLVGSTVS